MTGSNDPTNYIEQLEHRFRAIVENAPEEISLKDTDGRYLLVNGRFERLAGKPANEILGKTSAEIFGDDFAESGVDHDQEVIETGKPVEREEVFELAGRHRDFLTTKFPVFDGQGKVVAVGAVHVDLTERKAAEKVKSEFVAMVNHELRTPLTAISGALKMMTAGAGGSMPDTAVGLLEIAQRNVDRMTHLVDDLLDVSSIQAGGLVLSIEPVNLDELINEAADDLRQEAEASHITLSVMLEEGAYLVQADAKRLMQVMSNLLSNAVRHSPAGTEIVLGVRRLDDCYRMSVQDEGEGVPDTFRGDLFAPFQQVDGSNTRNSGGTGLGLSISKAIVEAHGGSIGYHANDGAGCTFYFDIPG